MVIGAKDVRSIKVCNLPENISNDVLRFLFKESTSVIRAPHSTSAIVEFNCVRDVAAYIRKDKTLMIEDKVLTIEGCSFKNEGTSNKDPLESRQLYIENIPHWTTTEYLDVLFPGAKSIRRVDGFTAVAEYRSAKDAQMEFLKTKTLRIDQNQLMVVPAKDYRRNTNNNDGSPAQNVGHYSLNRKGKGYQPSYARKPPFGSERSNPNSSSSGSYRSHKRHSASGSQHHEDNSSAVSPQDQLLSGNSTQANLLGLPQAFGKSSKSFQWKKPGSHHYSNLRSGRRRGTGRNTECRDGADAEGNECGDNDADNLTVHDPDGDGDVVEKPPRVEAKGSGQSQQQKKRTAAIAVSQNQSDSKTHLASGPAVGLTQKEAKANQSSSMLGRNQKEAKVTQRSSATEGASLNQKDSKTNQKSADSNQNQMEAKASHKVAPPMNKEKGVSSRRESSMTHGSSSDSKMDRAQSSTSKPVRDRSPHRDCPNKRMRTTCEPSTRGGGGSSRGRLKTSRETTAAPSSNDTSKGRRHSDEQQGEDGTTQKADGSVTNSVSNLLNKLDMLAALSQFAKDYEDAYQTTQKGSQDKYPETDTSKEKDVPPAGSTNTSKSKSGDLDRTTPQKNSTGSSRARHRGESSGNSDCTKRGTPHDHQRNTRASESSRMRHRGDSGAGDGSCDPVNRRNASRSRSSRSASWMSEPYIDSLRERHRYHSQSSAMATSNDRRSARSVRSPCYDPYEDDGGGGGGASRRDFLVRRSHVKYQPQGHNYCHGDDFDRDIHRHDRDDWNGSRFWDENDAGRSRSSYANADVDPMRSSEVRDRDSEDRGSSQPSSERRVWISGRLDHRNSSQGRSHQRDFRSDANHEKTVYWSNPDLSHWEDTEYDDGGGGGGGRRRRWEREEEEAEHDRIAQRFSETPGSCDRDRFDGGYDDYNYDDGGDCGRRNAFDRRDGKWTGDRRDMYERRKTNDEPFVPVHVNSGNDRLAFGDRERDGDEGVERGGRFRESSDERRYNHPDMDNDFHPHGNRRVPILSPPTHSINMTRSPPRGHYDSSSSRPPFHDSRRLTTATSSMNTSKSETQDYKADGTRHGGKRQNMTPHPYGPDTRTFRKGGDQEIAGNKINDRRYHGDKEWSVSPRDTDERKVFMMNSVKHGGDNSGRVSNTDGRGCGFDGGGRDVGRLGFGEKCQTGGFGTDGNREAGGGRFGSDVRCESGRFVDAEDRCKVSRFGGDGWSEGVRPGVDEQFSSNRFGPDNDEHCKAGKFSAEDNYDADRFDVDERSMAGRFDVDERCSTGPFNSNERLTITDVNDTEKRGPRSSGCDHDPSDGRISQKGEDENSMGVRKFGIGAGSFGGGREIDGSVPNFRAGKSLNSGGRFHRHVNNDMQDCQLAFDVDERQRYTPSEMERMHNRNADGIRFNRHRGIEGGNSPKTARTLEGGANSKDDIGDGSMRDDGEVSLHSVNTGGDDGGYSNHGENRDVDDRVFHQYNSNHNNGNNNNMWPNGRRYKTGFVGTQHGGNYNQNRGNSNRAWNRQTGNSNSLGLTDMPFQGSESRNKGSKRQFNVLSEGGKGPGIAGRSPPFGAFDTDNKSNRNDEMGVERGFNEGISDSLMSANDMTKIENPMGHRGGQYEPENVRGGTGDGDHTLRRDNGTNEETRINNSNNNKKNNNNNTNNSPGFNNMKHHRRELETGVALTSGFKGDPSQSYGHGQGHTQGQPQPQGYRQGHIQLQQPLSRAQQEQGGQNPTHFRTERRGSGDGGSSSGRGDGGNDGGSGAGGGGHFMDFRCPPLPGMPSSPYPSAGLSGGLQQHHRRHQQQQQPHPASTRMPTRASPPGLGTFQQAFPPPPPAASLLPPPPIRGLPNGPFPTAVNPGAGLHHPPPPPPPSVPVGLVWPLVPLPPPTTLPLVDNAFYQAPAFNN